MTLEELENTLPNGLHDAKVQGITVDYAQRKVWVNDCATSYRTSQELAAKG